MVSVVVDAAPDDVHCLYPVVHVNNLYASGSVARKLFVTQKIVFQTIDQGFRTLLNIRDVAVCKVRLEHGEDFVVGLLTVDHPQPAYWLRMKEEAPLGKRLLRQHADVHWVAITLNAVCSRSFGA